MANKEELNLFQELFTYQNLVHAISGATGGIVAISVFYPLNNIRIRVQVDESLKSEDPFVVGKDIVARHGISALYQGWWSAVVSLGASNFVYFYVYNAFKTLYQVKVLGGKKNAMGNAANLAIAAAAGVINVFSTTPLWVVGTRLTAQDTKSYSKNAAKEEVNDRSKPYEGIVDCLVRITKEEGFFSMWKGVGPSLVLVSNPTIQFVAYEWLRRINETIAKARGGEITAAEFFILGALAKAIATIVTYPLQVAQSKLRNDRGGGHGHGAKKEEPKDGKAAAAKEAPYAGTVDCLYRIWMKEGLNGWFKGFTAKLWQTVLTAAFQFLVYEKISAAIMAVFLPNQAGAKVGH